MGGVRCFNLQFKNHAIFYAMRLMVVFLERGNKVTVIDD